jgi:hypothetical protein
VRAAAAAAAGWKGLLWLAFSTGVLWEVCGPQKHSMRLDCTYHSLQNCVLSWRGEAADQRLAASRLLRATPAPGGYDWGVRYVCQFDGYMPQVLLFFHGPDFLESAQACWQGCAPAACQQATQSQTCPRCVADIVVCAWFASAASAAAAAAVKGFFRLRLHRRALRWM